MLWDLQLAIDDRLYGSLEHNGIPVEIYDTIPDGAKFPYVKINESNFSDWNTKTDYGANITQTLIVFDNQGNKRRTKEIMRKIELLMRDNIVIQDDLIISKLEFQEVLEEDDKYNYGVMRFRFYIREGVI